MKLSSRVSFYRTIIPKIARVLACCEFEDSRRRKNIYENIYIRKIFILSRINYYSNGKIDPFSHNTFRRFVADAKWTSIKKKKLNNFHVTIRINSLFIKAIILVFKGEKKNIYRLRWFWIDETRTKEKRGDCSRKRYEPLSIDRGIRLKLPVHDEFLSYRDE